MKYLIHDTVGHTAMAIAKVVGAKRLAYRLHDATLPRTDKRYRSLF